MATVSVIERYIGKDHAVRSPLGTESGNPHKKLNMTKPSLMPPRETLPSSSTDAGDDFLDPYSTLHESSIRSSDSVSGVAVLDVKAMRRRTIIVGIFILFLGLVATFLFIWFGVEGATEEADDAFTSRANELTLFVETTWGEYERTAASAHEICNRGGGITTRREFLEFYEYLLADVLDFQSIQCIPKVHHKDRAAHEAEAKEYWEARLPNYTYAGFQGIIFDIEAGVATGVESPESVQPYYWPIKYCEPPQGNEAAIDLDVYLDKGMFQPLLDQSIQSHQPVLSQRINTVQETEDFAYSVLIYHPGIPLSTQPGKVPDMFSSLVVRVPTLLDRVARLQEEDLAVYLYDIRPGGRLEFLGAAEYRVSKDMDGNRVTKVTFPPEVDFESLRSQFNDNRFQEDIIPIASGSWSVVVVPVDDSYDPALTLVIFGGCMLLVATIGITVWMYSNMKRVVEIYKAKTEAEAERTIVASMFPANVRDRLLQGTAAQNEVKKERARMRLNGLPTTSSEDKNDHLSSEGLFGSKPIADFHPEATLMFADLRGFTAWSSVREPSQVFTLLEVLYNAFDRVARRRRVFKVETVGDCYVASAGAPEPRPDHAVAMARFARDCLGLMPKIVHKLETSLGPDTGDLRIRIGLHTGAVTSGVLRGDKGRFQLFGDTINTASRMEGSGLPNRIQVSPDTAECLRDAGKGHWLETRDTTVFVKGSGDLQTFWLKHEKEEEESVTQNDSVQFDDTFSSDRSGRLASWNAEQMSMLLKMVMASRHAKISRTKYQRHPSLELLAVEKPLDEVKDVLTLPEFDESALVDEVNLDSIELSETVTLQLNKLVKQIASMYHQNPFHNFEHASHVAMSVTKLLTRIVNPRELKAENTNAEELHDHTFGITSDPLTQFAAFFSAIIHDVDHQGVPNTALAKEKPDLAEIYDRSLAEQNSVDMTWALFMREEYNDLRSCICADDTELRHFRQLIVQMVLATDIMDKDLGALRKQRWKKAFDDQAPEEDQVQVRNRKATIVIEHLLQASDVSHTMQHWHIYRKWNECLFMETYKAFKEGRLEKDPTESWYEGELGFFDFYVIPLAKKLETCGVFGVSSDEFRIYATANRKEWELKGEQMVRDYLEKIKETDGEEP